MNNFQQSGRVLDLTAPSGGVIAGSVYKVGVFIGVAISSVDQGQKFAMALDGVVNPAPKKSGEAWTEGALLYWDDTNKYFTTTSTSNTKCGGAAAAAQSADTVGAVRLQQTGG